MSAVGWTIFAIAATVLLRVLLIARLDLLRLEEIHARNNDLIRRGEFEAAERGMLDYDKLKEGQFWRVFDLSKWTYRQFFGSVE
jgi:hypothetical protein